MKREFTKLMAALALLVGLTIPLGMWGQTTYKLQAVTSVQAGEKYVFLQDGYVIKNTVTSSKLYTTNSYSTSGLTGSEIYVWTFEDAGNSKLYLKSANDSKYVNNSSSGSMTLDDTGSSKWSITFSNEVALFTNTSNSNRFLGYNNTTEHCYKTYASSNLNTYAHDITVYKLVEEGPVVPQPYINIVPRAGEEDPQIVADPYTIECEYVSFGGYLRAIEFGNFTITDASAFQKVFCNANGQTVDGNPYEDILISSTGEVDYYELTGEYRLEVGVKVNNNPQDRYAYFKVWANVNNTPVYSDLVTVHQAGKPRVATPTFSPVAGAVNSGTEVTISCTTEDAAIQYSTDGTNYNEYTAPIVINEAMTLYAKATAEGYVDSEVAMANYTVKGNAVFEDGVYTESMADQASFGNMEVISVSGDESWVFSTTYNCAFIKQSDAQEDWLITPKMAVDNGKLLASFQIYHKNLEQNGIALKWSTSNNTSGTWQDVEFDKGNPSGWHNVSNLVIETGDAENIYLAFVYKNVNTANAQCQIKNLTVRQYYNVTFEANDPSATGTMDDLACVAGVATALTANSYAVEGRVFNGWNTKADGQGTAYVDGANITITANTTLYAQWLDTYKVKFTTNGIEDVTMQVVKEQAIGTLPTANAAYIPAGYEFKGWLASEYQSDDAPIAYIGTDYVPDSDVTLYAVFAEATSTQTATNLTYTLEPDDFSGASYNANNGDKTIHDVSLHITDVMKSSEAIQMKKSTGNLFNNDALGDYITSIVINVKSGTFSVYEGTASNPSDAVSGTGSNTKTYTFSNGMQYFKIAGNTSGAALANSITVNYVGYTTIYSYSNYRTSLTENHTLSISGYADVTGINNTGYHFIASPVYVDPATVNGMTEGDYDLYYFDEAKDHEEWRNYEASNFNLVPGTGYLYAKKATAATPTYNFTLTGAPYNGNGQVTLHKTEGTQFSGWNLIGNPFTTAATLDMPFYKMNSDGDGFTAKIEDLTNTIAAMEGVFVQATATSLTATFTAQNAKSGKRNIAKVELMVSGNRGTVIDNAIVRFDNGETLEKFVLRENGTKLYFTEGNQDYAIVCSNGQGEMPVNFKAETSGTYTISVNAENTEMNYLHLIDNMTGNDVDLLATPSYTFEANTTDYASRFRLVFNANNGNNENGNETFAYFNGSEWVINNPSTGSGDNATLQVIDMMGRVLSSETISGNANVNINQAAGIYMLRLVNGENVMVQKVVVR